MNRIKNRLTALERTKNGDGYWLWLSVPTGISEARKSELFQKFAGQYGLPSNVQYSVREDDDCAEPTVLFAGNLTKTLESVANREKQRRDKQDGV
jgi:hypothetical protein